jgi:hypothetical protein
VTDGFALCRIIAANALHLKPNVLPDQTDLAGAAQVPLSGPIPLFPENESKAGSRLTNSCPI